MCAEERRSGNVFQLLPDEWPSVQSSWNRVGTLILHRALQVWFYNTDREPPHSVLIRDDEQLWILI